MKSSHRKASRNKRAQMDNDYGPSTYNLLAEIMSSDDAPMPPEKRRHQLTRMYEGLRAIETAPSPTTDDWRVCSDAVNLMETLVDTMHQCQDTTGLLHDAVEALAMAGKRYMTHGTIRMDAKGIFAVRSVLEDYADMLAVLSHRTMIRCHRLTEQRVRDILAGKSKPHDVEIIDL